MKPLRFTTLSSIFPIILSVGCVGKHSASELNQTSAKQGLSDRKAGDFIYPLGFEADGAGNVITRGLRGGGDFVIINDSISAFLLEPSLAPVMPTIVEKSK